MSKRERNNQVLMGLAKKVFLEVRKGELIIETSDEEQIIFHEFARFLKTSPLYRAKSRECFDDANAYPFIKLHGSWFLSLPKAYLYFFGNRYLIASFVGNDSMMRLHDAIQLVQKYSKDARELDEKTSPTDVENFADHQAKQARLYEEYLLEQKKLFN